MPFDYISKLLASLLLLAPAIGWAQTAKACPALLQHSFARLQDEKPVNLCAFAGQVVVVVNTASECGYTPQYKSLEALYDVLAPQLGLMTGTSPLKDTLDQSSPGDLS